MVTVSLARPAVALELPPPTERCLEAVVRDLDGHMLSRALLPSRPDGDCLPLDDVDDQSPLMTYYFGRGGRDVLLTLADSAFHARLETCWEGNHRNWWLDLRN